MEICVLGSGSSGNCTYVATGDTRVLIDAGLGYSDTCNRLDKIGVSPNTLSGVLLTHHHADHCKSADAIQRRHDAPLFANKGTTSNIKNLAKTTNKVWTNFESCSPFTVGSLLVEAFPLQHDAADTVGFVLTDGSIRLGVATDLGTITPIVEEKLSLCDVLILETNYDPVKLDNSGRPRSRIARIRGPKGHLSNEKAAELLTRLLCPRLRNVFMAHRSSDCNTPFLAEEALEAVLQKAGREDIRLMHTHSDAISEIIEISA